MIQSSRLVLMVETKQGKGVEGDPVRTVRTILCPQTGHVLEVCDPNESWEKNRMRLRLRELEEKCGETS